jgi:hypothetical protein
MKMATTLKYYEGLMINNGLPKRWVANQYF